MGSVYDMVERILEQMDVVRSVLSEDRASAHLSPSWQDCDVLHSIAAALKGLKSMTDALAAEECVTASAVKLLLSYLTEKVLVAEDDDTSLTKEIKRRIKDDLEARYENSDFLLQLSSFLDPRFKVNYVNDRAEVMEEVERQMRGLIEPDSSSVDGASHLPASSQPGRSGMAAPPAKRAKGLSKVLGCF